MHFARISGASAPASANYAPQPRTAAEVKAYVLDAIAHWRSRISTLDATRIRALMGEMNDGSFMSVEVARSATVERIAYYKDSRIFMSSGGPNVPTRFYQIH